MDRLRKDGVAIMFVTHRLEEASAICDRMTVLRDGKLAGHLNRDGKPVPLPRIIEKMVGRAASELYAQADAARRRRRRAPVDPRPAHRARSRGAARHRARRRRPRPQGRRDPRRRRPRRLRPHRARPRHFRRRPHRRRHDHARRPADRAGLAGRRDRARHRAGAGGPQAPGDLRRARHPAQFLDRRARRASATASASWPSGASARRWPTSEDAVDPHGLARAGDRRSVRRQPAEGGARPLAGARPEGADRRRADARRRCRRQGRGAPDPRAACGARHCRHDDLVGIARSACGQRPDRHHAARPHHRRDARHRGERGETDGTDGARSGPGGPDELDGAQEQHGRRAASAAASTWRGC